MLLCVLDATTPTPTTPTPTTESTNSRVLWYSVFTIVVLLTLGATQLFILRRDFKNKKII